MYARTHNNRVVQSIAYFKIAQYRLLLPFVLCASMCAVVFQFDSIRFIHSSKRTHSFQYCIYIWARARVVVCMRRRCLSAVHLFSLQFATVKHDRSIPFHFNTSSCCRIILLLLLLLFLLLLLLSYSFFFSAFIFRSSRFPLIISFNTFSVVTNNEFRLPS